MILIDVGAAGEILPRFSGIKNKTTVAFEPDPEAFIDLQKKYSSQNYIIINEALSSKEQELEEKYKNLTDDYNNLSKKLDEFQDQEKIEKKKQIEFSEKIDELNQETDTLLDEIDKWQT